MLHDDFTYEFIIKTKTHGILKIFKTEKFKTY
jgi:hypothetical protein